MRQVIIVLIALLAISIFMPAISAKAGNTGPLLVSVTNMSKVAPTVAVPDWAVMGITPTMKDFINGTTSTSPANFQDIMNNNNAARWDILGFLNPAYNPYVDTFPPAAPVYKKHVMS